MGKNFWKLIKNNGNHSKICENWPKLWDKWIKIRQKWINSEENWSKVTKKNCGKFINNHEKTLKNELENVINYKMKKIVGNHQKFCNLIKIHGKSEKLSKIKKKT